MLQEKNSTGFDSVLAVPLSAVTRLVLRFPLATLVLAVVAALMSIVWTANQLSFRASRLDLLNPEKQLQQTMDRLHQRIWR